MASRITIAIALLGVICVTAAAAPARAQDAVKADPKHYKVVLENDQVRVLRITYGPHEKSVTHSHPAGVVVYMTDLQGKMTGSDGKMQDVAQKAGTVAWSAATTHLPENAGDKAFEVIQVELKTRPAAAK